MSSYPKPFVWENKTVLVTGGTGSFGRRFVEMLLEEHAPKRLIVFSRDEQKQHEMQQEIAESDSVRYVIGSVRDPHRLRAAFDGIDVVIHAAAMKQIPTCEKHTTEAMLTNVSGARHVIDAAVACAVGCVMNLSTDKAVKPVSAYGATKLLAEKLFIEASVSREGRPPHFATVRYGNVVGTRGSVIPLFRQQRGRGVVTVTDPRMTRFWITRDDGVRFVMRCVERMRGGEIFIPKVPSAGIRSLVEVLAPGCRVERIGIRPGEKLHEILISEDESRFVRELEDMFIVRPGGWNASDDPEGHTLPEGYTYTSDVTARQLSGEELRILVEEDAGAKV